MAVMPLLTDLPLASTAAGNSVEFRQVWAKQTVMNEKDAQ
jgi:hypothetical protein